MAKEPEVSGQVCPFCREPIGDGYSHDCGSTVSEQEMQDTRQLSCGCWVPLDHTGACASHGVDLREPTVPELQAVIRELRLREESLRKDLRDRHRPPKKAYGLLRTMTREEFEALGFQPSWLDEVARDMMAAMVEPDLVNCTDRDVLRFVERARVIAYNLAQALLAEGKKRREAKGE